MITRSCKLGSFGLMISVVLAGAFLLSSSQPGTQGAKRGEYLVKGTGCGDCHTPLKMGPSGPEPDNSRLLSGHPEALAMPPVPHLPEGPWLVVVSATQTAWAGPWGTSFTANLTPDRETGLGAWTAQTFVDTIRSGRRMGRGRQLLMPMPYLAMQNMTDEDLKVIFAYLQTIPLTVNRVPDPVPPQIAALR